MDNHNENHNENPNETPDEITTEKPFDKNEEFKGDTPVGAPFKVQYRMEIAKIREMTFKKKAEYIWEYYKIPIIAFVAILLMIGSLINIWFINPPATTTLLISWNASFAPDTAMTDLAAVLNYRIIDEKKNEKVEVISIWISEEFGDPMMNMGNMQRLVAMVAAGSIDVFILNTELLEEYTEGGMIQPLEDILADVRARNPIVYNRIMDNTVKLPHESEDGRITEKIMGISVGDRPLLSDFTHFQQELFFAVVTNSSNLNNVAKALIVLFE